MRAKTILCLAACVLLFFMVGDVAGAPGLTEPRLFIRHRSTAMTMQ